jgi:hypothetical protein
MRERNEGPLAAGTPPATLQAGRELDALVAEKVMGWTVNRTESRHWHTVGPTGRERNIQIGSDCCAGQAYDSNAFMPSKSIVSAWLVVEKMRERGWNFELHTSRDGEAAAAFHQSQDDDFEAYELTAPLAICRAALSAASVAEHQDV